MGPYGSENFKVLLLIQMALKLFRTFPEFSSQQSSMLMNFFFCSGPYGSKTFKMLLLLEG